MHDVFIDIDDRSTDDYRKSSYLIIKLLRTLNDNIMKFSGKSTVNSNYFGKTLSV